MGKVAYHSILGTRFSFVIIGSVLTAAMFTAMPVGASVLFVGSAAGNDSGELNSASVKFDLTISGTTTNLVVMLSNTATYDPNDPSDILSAVFSSLSGNPTLTANSAVVAPGGGVKGNGGLTDPGGVVGGEWAYASSLSIDGAN